MRGVAIVSKVLIAAGLTWFGPLAGAQNGAADVPTTSYVDSNLGFEMALPAGWSFDRTRFVGPGSSVGLLRAAAPNARETIQIFAHRVSGAPPFATWLETFIRQIAAVSGSPKVEGTPRPHGDRDGAVVTVDARIGADRTRTLYYCVRFDPSTVWVFCYAAVMTPPIDEAAMAARFERLVSTLQVRFDPLEAEKLQAAFDLGLKSRPQVRELLPELQIDESTRYYDLALRGKSIGYLTRQFSRERRSLDDPRYGNQGREGVRLRERLWRFGDDGSAYLSKTDMFSSFDLQAELIETDRTTIAPDRPDAPPPFRSRDQCIRADKTLFSSLVTSRDKDMPEPRQPIEVSPTYLSLAVARLMPVILGTETTELHAFAVYDPETRALTTHTIRGLGPPASGEDTAATTLVFELREGLAGQPTRLTTDARGYMLEFAAGDLLLRAVTQAEIEQKYSARRDAATRRAR